MDWQQILLYGGPILLLIVEYFLGKTDKVEANSTLGLLENILKLFGKKK